MSSFLRRFLTDNGASLAAVLQKLAAQIAEGLPGPPRFALLVLHDDKEAQMGQITVKDSDPDFRAEVTFLDAKGSPTEPDDVPQWAVDDASIVAVAADGDGLGATLTPGSPGNATAATAQVTVTSTDADGTVVTSVGTVTVTSGEAVVGDVEFQAAAPA